MSEHGKLHVQGTQLCDEHGAAVELHGMSSHGIQWFPQYTTKQAIANTAAYGANLFRVAMYTGEGGYLSSPAQIKKAAYAAMDAALKPGTPTNRPWTGNDLTPSGKFVFSHF